MPTTPTERVAAEVRAWMARNRKKNIDLAAALGIRPQSLSRRLSGEQPFTLDELVIVANFIGVDVAELTQAIAS